jgi:hypothetical protein
VKLSSPLKKILGILIIIVFGLIQLALLTTFLHEAIAGDGSRTMTTLAETVFTMGIMAFPIWYGFRLWKSANATVPTNPSSTPVHLSTPPTSLEAIKIQVKLDLPEYRKLVFRLTYTMPAFIWIYFIGTMMLFFLLLNGEPNWLVLFIVLFLLFLPVSVFRGATANYKATKALHEPITYAFTPDSITTYGESFQSTIQWNALHKIRESGPWLMLYTNKQVAMMIPKKAFASDAELETVKQIARDNNISS